MRNVLITMLVMLGVIAITASMAAAGNGPMTGPNAFKWARDDDGDGIPNGLDPDWLPPQDGSGYGHIGPFVGPVLFSPERAIVRNVYRHRNGTPADVTRGDFLRTRLHTRDHTCW